MRTLLRLFAALTLSGLFAHAPAPAATPPSFSISPAGAQEDSGKLCFPVKMHGTRSTAPSTVTASLIAGTAKAGEDYVAAVKTVTFQPGEFGLFKQACFDLVNDARPEPTETVTGKLTKVSNARLYVGGALGTILDSDVAAPPPPPPPSEPPPPSGKPRLVSEGDSISVTWGSCSGGNHTAMFALCRTATVTHCGLAVGGSVLGSPTDANGLTNPTRLAKVDDCAPNLVTVLIGANDLVSWNPAWTADTWLARLWGYVATLKAKGYKVAVGTILPQYQPNSPVANYTAEFNARRKVVNTAIKAAVGSKIDAVIDFAADPVIGPDAAAQDKALYYDGIHPTDGCGLGCGGQGRLAAVYAPVVDKLLTQPTTPPPTEPPPPPPSGTGWIAADLWAGAPYARALSDCASVNRTAETDRVGLAIAGVKAGTVYKLVVGGSGSGRSGSPAAAWGWTPFKNVEGRSGDTWTLEDPAGGEEITVPQACLEGVKPAA